MTYVLSDIHGNERRFDSVMNQINLQPTDTLYVLGDVIDRHPDGIHILRRIMAMSNVKMLLGNHEYMMLNALGYPYNFVVDKAVLGWENEMYLWYGNGGKVTHEQFNELSTTEQIEIINYLRNLPLNADVDVDGVHYKLVHAAPLEEYSEDYNFDNATEFAVWHRYLCPCEANREYTMVFGHSTTNHYQDIFPMELWQGNNCIGIDCGSGYPESRHYRNTGRLACLRLDDGKVFYSEELAA